MEDQNFLSVDVPPMERSPGCTCPPMSSLFHNCTVCILMNIEAERYVTYCNSVLTLRQSSGTDGPDHNG